MMIKKQIACQQLITEQETVPQEEYTLSPDEFDRLTDYVSLLITIDRKNKSKKKEDRSHEQPW